MNTHEKIYEVIYPPQLKGIGSASKKEAAQEKNKVEPLGQKKDKPIKKRPSVGKEQKVTFEETQRIIHAKSRFFPGFAHHIRYDFEYKSVSEREEALKNYVKYCFRLDA